MLKAVPSRDMGVSYLKIGQSIGCFPLFLWGITANVRYAFMNRSAPPYIQESVSDRRA